MKKNSKYESLKTIFFAIYIALLIRSFIAEPFNIPSGSMKPTLLKGDFLFVKKWSYGYSKHSLPFSLPLINNRIFYKEPIRGDVAVFKTPEDNKTDYIKRIIGLPGDKILLANGIVFLNNKPLSKMQIGDFTEKDYDNIVKFKSAIDLNIFTNISISEGGDVIISQFEEYIGNYKYKILDIHNNSIGDNTNEFIVPEDYFFVLGDNRDNSQDSRFIIPGFIPINNLVGKAWIVFFSLENSRFFEIWKWPKSIRYSRIFSLIS